MTKRYGTISSWCDYQETRHSGVETLAREIHESDKSPFATGVLDESGSMIFAFDDVSPIGFVHFKDKQL